MSNRDPLLLLEDIVESIEKIRHFTVNIDFEEFINDAKTTDAVVRNFEIIGEAATKIPPEIKNRYSNIEWHRIVSIRNRIIHEYFGVDYSIIWKIIELNLDKLKSDIERILIEL
ncbi:MAG: DUF86 domain-containing protein [Bacteroidetes bacterium]|nr:DUF86 domain-containing protein [Bacteroidota bacterium]